MEDLGLNTSNCHIVEDGARSVENRTQEYRVGGGGNLSSYIGRKYSRAVRKLNSGLLAHIYTLFDTGQINEPL